MEGRLTYSPMGYLLEMIAGDGDIGSSAGGTGAALAVLVALWISW